MIKEAHPGDFKKAMIALCIVATLIIGLIGSFIYINTYGNPIWVSEHKYNEAASKILTDALSNQTTDSTKQQTELTDEEYNQIIQDRRLLFANQIIVNMQGTCEKAYFNSKGEFIIVVNSDWYNFKKEEKQDIIYLIENDLKKEKENLDVEGFGQFFSNAGRGLETFYAK